MKRFNLTGLTYRHATRDDLVAFYGKAPACSIRALVFLDGDKIVAIGGMKREDGRWVAFSEIKPDVKLGKLTIWRCAKLVMEMLEAMKLPIWAVAEQQGAETGLLVRHLGFQHEGEIKAGEVYVLWPS